MSEQIDTSMLDEMLANGLLTADDHAIEVAALHGTGTDEIDEVLETELSTIDTTPVMPETLDEVAYELAASDAREEVYAEQTSVTNLVEASTTPEKAPRAKREPKTPAEPRKARINAGGTLGIYVSKIVGDEIVLTSGADPVPTAALVDGISAKKVQEKAVNLFDAMKGRRQLSVFTQRAFETLRRGDVLTAKHLAADLGTGDDPYSEGTARSQAQQMTQLFSALQIVGEGGKARSDSELFRHFVPAV